MKEQIPLNFEPEKKKRPHPSEEEILADIRARAKKNNEKSSEYGLPPNATDFHEKKYRNEK